jgi:chromosome segregation ATPase
MADFENTVIINVDLTPDDAARKAEAVAKSIADIKKEQDELKKSNQQSSAAYTQNQLQLQKLQRELKAYVTISQQATGSNNQLRAQLSLLNAQYDALSKTERETTSQGSLLLAQIKGINDELARSEAASGRFQRNVGNYPGQLGSAVNQFASYAPISGFGSGIIYICHAGQYHQLYSIGRLPDTSHERPGNG